MSVDKHERALYFIGAHYLDDKDINKGIEKKNTF